jgi:predicted small metal-binding protein
VATVYYLNCKDLGIDCEFETRGENVEKVIEQCADHGRAEHGIRSFSPELYAKMRSHLHKVEEAPST